MLNRAFRLASNAASPAGVPSPPAAIAAVRAVARYSPIVAQPSFQKVRLKAASETLSPNHWCMFSWLNVPSDVPVEPPIWPPAKVILPCISSSKLAGGVPTTTPSVVMGQGPSNSCWKLTMSSWLSMAILFVALRAAVIVLACASQYWTPEVGLVRALRS